MISFWVWSFRLPNNHLHLCQEQFLIEVFILSRFWHHPLLTIILTWVKCLLTICHSYCPKTPILEFHFIIVVQMNEPNYQLWQCLSIICLRWFSNPLWKIHCEFTCNSFCVILPLLFSSFGLNSLRLAQHNLVYLLWIHKH